MSGLTAIGVRNEFNRERIDRLKRGAKVYVVFNGKERVPVMSIEIDVDGNAVDLHVDDIGEFGRLEVDELDAGHPMLGGTATTDESPESEVE